MTDPPAPGPQPSPRTLQMQTIMRNQLKLNRQQNELGTKHLQQINELRNQLKDLGEEGPENRPSPGGPPDPGRPPREHGSFYLLPQPSPGPNFPQDPLPAPTGVAPEDAPFWGVKPIFMPPPKPFAGDHADISRFIGDCEAYFAMFSIYFPYPSQKALFAAHHLKGPAKDWWVYQ